MNEIIVNLHMHTYYSDGFATHTEIAQAALDAKLDAVIVTDHNVWVNGPEKYYQNGAQKVLMLVGEEVHDRTREPQKNHMLVFGADRELVSYARDPQRILDSAKEAGGVAFLAHPFDPPAPTFDQPDLSWVTWDIQGYTGIELWNSMTELKSHLKSYLNAVYYAFFPKDVAVQPFPETLAKWDDLLRSGQRVVAVGGSDAHGMPAHLGPIKRIIFPYRFHFQCINTHLLLSEPLTGQVDHDKSLIIEALRTGHAFIGYDLPGSTKGFRFTAQGKDKTVIMGDEIQLKQGITIQIRLPSRTKCLLLKDGHVIKTWKNRSNCTYIASEPGVYRVEVYTHYFGRQRGWIYSNPIYVRE